MNNEQRAYAAQRIKELGAEAIKTLPHASPNTNDLFQIVRATGLRPETRAEFHERLRNLRHGHPDDIWFSSRIAIKSLYSFPLAPTSVNLDAADKAISAWYLGKDADRKEKVAAINAKVVELTDALMLDGADKVATTALKEFQAFLKAL